MILGIIAMLFPLISGIKAQVISFLVENSLPLFLFGLGSTLIGAALAIHIILTSRRRYVTIRSGKKTISISEAVMQDYLSSYWKEIVPDREVPFRIQLKSHKIRILVDLPYFPKEEQKSLLEKIERDLNDLFRGIFGYQEALELEVSFQSAKKASNLSYNA